MSIEDEHLTNIRRLGDDLIQATCPEHRGIGLTQPQTRTGINAVVTEARGHDDIVHGVYRPDDVYRAALSARNTRETQ